MSYFSNVFRLIYFLCSLDHFTVYVLFGHLDEVHTFYGKQPYLLRLLSSPGGMSIREGTFIYFRDIVQGVLLLRRVRLFGTIE